MGTILVRITRDWQETVPLPVFRRVTSWSLARHPQTVLGKGCLLKRKHPHNTQQQQPEDPPPQAEPCVVSIVNGTRGWYVICSQRSAAVDVTIGIVHGTGLNFCSVTPPSLLVVVL